MTDVLLDPIFNLQTVPPIKPGKSLDDPSDIVTEVFIETARPIVLTQDAKKQLLETRRNYVYLPSTASIAIHADEVTVCGKLSFPGRNVVIFARVLGAEDDGANPATISVDGAPLADDVAHPKALTKGKSPKDKPDKPKVGRGEPEWSLRDHPEMNGEDGDKGNDGNAAGNVWICCHETSFRGTAHTLIITAKGGPGGDGQPGQDGADGGKGHDGRSCEGGRYPERGTNGGDGGNGGKGGKAGTGGKGGSIIFHCLTSQPAVSIHYEGGDPGARGTGGIRGDKGAGGKGGKGGWISRSAGVGPPIMEQVDAAPDGPDGQYGQNGADGDKADPSEGGSSNTTWGKVDSAALMQRASVTQLQMLFERTRADYLVTEPRDYSLRLMAVAPPAGAPAKDSALPDLVNDGTNLVVVGRSRDGLHVRIFDASGQIVVDKQEAEMIEDQRRFLISIADVLEAGNWATPEELHAMPSQAQRQPLIKQLSRIAGLCDDAFNKVNDYDLTGWGAVTAFLLQMGIRDEAGLKLNLEAYRNALIPEIARNTGYDEGGLRTLNNQELVQVALDPELVSLAPRNRFVLRGGMEFLRHRLFGSGIPPLTMCDVLQAGGWVTAHQLSWMQLPEHRQLLTNQLRWKTGLLQDFGNLYDGDLIGKGAVMAFLLQMGIRDEASLKGNRECGRDTLIAEIANKCGYPRKDLEGWNNEDLIRLALEPKPNNKFALQGGMIFLRGRLFPTISLADVLEAGGWVALAQLQGMSAQAQRQALIDQLSRISDLRKDIFEQLNDHDLIGYGAVMAFLLEMGIRDKASIKANLGDYRNTLIMEFAGKCGYDGTYLQGRNNHELVQLALEPKDRNKFVFRGGMLLLRHRLPGTEKILALKRLFEMSVSDVLRAGGWVAPDQLTKMPVEDQRQVLIDQLSRITELPKEHFGMLTDYDLIGRGAVLAFLLQMGIRDEAGLKVDLEPYRSALIQELARNTGYDERALRKLNNQELVHVALNPEPRNKFVLRGALADLRERLFGPMFLPDVLEAGGWVAPDQLKTMPVQDQRKALIDQLSRISGRPAHEIEGLNDHDLAGWGAVATFLLQMGICDEAGLKGPLQSHRDILIKEAAAKARYDEHSLQGVDNYQLVRAALEPKAGNAFIPQGGMVLLRNRLFPTMSMADVLEAGGWVAPDQLKTDAYMLVQNQRQALFDQLSRITGRPPEEIWNQIFNRGINDHALAGLGAVAAFLLQMGIRDEAGLKGPLWGLRDTLIQEAAANTSYAQYTLKGLDNHQLVRVALEPKPGNKFVLRGGMLLLRTRLFPTMSLADVLQAGNWRTPAQLDKMSAQDQRQALIEELSRITSLTKAEYNTLNDYDLIGRGLAIVFVLQMGIRDEAGLKVHLDNDRNTLIVEIAGKCGYDGGYLQGMDNQQLVRLALEPKPTNHFVLRGNLLDLRDRFCNVSNLPLKQQQGIIAAAAELGNYTDTWSSIGDRLDWLFQLLKAASEDYPLNRAYEHPEKDLAKAIKPSVWAAVNSHVCNLDYYGQSPRWVPTLSLGEYLEAFGTSVKLLKNIETVYKDYFAAWNDQKTAMTNLQSALNSAKDYSAFLDKRIAAIRTKKSDTESDIKRHDDTRKALHDSLNEALKGFRSEIKSAFGLTWETFFNCLSQLGFASVSEPARALKNVRQMGGFVKAGLVEGGAVVGGFASAGAMVAGPLGVMLKEAKSNILTDSGEPVNKSWLLDQIDVIEGDVDLRSALEERNGGFKDDTTSMRLVVELNKFKELCKKFYTSASSLRASLDAYINNITARNRYIDFYNGLAQDLLDLLAEKKKLDNREKVVQGQLSKTSNPGLPAMATFVSALYERAKAECLSDFYLASRAYSFWALEPYGKFYESLRSPGAITGTQLEAAHGTFINHIRKRLEDGFGRGNFTPPREDSEESIGVVVVLSKESHPDFFDDLESENKADFELEPATFCSTQPPDYAPTTAAWYGSTRPKFDPSAPNPFHGRANVRLRKVRPWIVGMETKFHKHTVQLIHLGEERFRRSDNVPYPNGSDEQHSEYVLHGATPITFTYSSDGLSWDPVNNTFTPGKLFTGGVPGASDGDLGFPQPGAGVDESVYAPIGPFGKWRVIVDPGNNLSLKWDNVQAIVIDFHVFKQAFDYDLDRAVVCGQ